MRGCRLAAWSATCSLVVASCSLTECGGPEPAPPAAAASEPSVTLRFRPLADFAHREHWVYDLEIPGTGIVRNAVSLDVSLAGKVEHDAFAVRATVREQAVFEDRKPIPAPGIAGATLAYVWGRSHALRAEIAADAKTPELSALAKAGAEAARFGTLIEYPDEAVAVGDSWSIEPQTLTIAPNVAATLRPSYTLEKIEGRAGATHAVISSDVQVDLVPVPVAAGISVQGGGTASGTMRVRLRDGLLTSAKSVMHFSQEIAIEGGDVLGYREFSATAHVFTTPEATEPDLAAEPYALERQEPDRECHLSLSSAAQRMRSMPVRQRAPLAAVHALALPLSRGGAPLREVGTTLVVTPTLAELDGTKTDAKELPRAVRAAWLATPGPLYVFGDAAAHPARIAPALAALPKHAAVRLVVHDADAPTPAPRAPRWHEERLRLSLASQTAAERTRQLNELLTAHLLLCEPALLSLSKVIATGHGWDSLRGEIINAFVRCGCNATSLDGLEATLYALYGSPDLRALPWPRLDAADGAEPLSFADLAKLAAPAGKPRAAHAP